MHQAPPNAAVGWSRTFRHLATRPDRCAPKHTHAPAAGRGMRRVAWRFVRLREGYLEATSLGTGKIT
jgi:hypothetical protein